MKSCDLGCGEKQLVRAKYEEKKAYDEALTHRLKVKPC